MGELIDVFNQLANGSGRADNGGVAAGNRIGAASLLRRRLAEDGGMKV